MCGKAGKAPASDLLSGDHSVEVANGGHGLNIVTSRPAKSLTLRVTRVRRCSSAVAAIWPSGILRGFPASCRCPSKTPQRSATDRVTGKMRPKKRFDRSISIHASSSSLRFPGDLRTMPLRNSPKLTALMNRASRGCETTRRNHRLRLRTYQFRRNICVQQKTTHSKTTLLKIDGASK